MIPNVTKCTVNSKGDLCINRESHKFIGMPCIFIKTCKSGLYQVALLSNRRLTISVPRSNIDSEPLPVVNGSDTLEANVKYLLDKCPFTVRCREGGGPEDLIGSLAITFIGMQDRFMRAQGFENWKPGDK